MDHRKLGLRVYATAADYPTAFRLTETLIAALAPIATVRECRVYPYWKFEDQFGRWLELASPDQAAAFDAVKADVASRLAKQQSLQAARTKAQAVKAALAKAPNWQAVAEDLAPMSKGPHFRWFLSAEDRTAYEEKLKAMNVFA